MVSVTAPDRRRKKQTYTLGHPELNFEERLVRDVSILLHLNLTDGLDPTADNHLRY